MRNTRNTPIVRVGRIECCLRCSANLRAELDDLACIHPLKSRPVCLRLDHDIEIPAIGKIDRQRSKAFDIDFEVLSMQIAGDVEKPHLLDLAA
jgi:hypothetical protein